MPVNAYVSRDGKKLFQFTSNQSGRLITKRFYTAEEVDQIVNQMKSEIDTLQKKLNQL